MKLRYDLLSRLTTAAASVCFVLAFLATPSVGYSQVGIGGGGGSDGEPITCATNPGPSGECAGCVNPDAKCSPPAGASCNPTKTYCCQCS